MEYFIGDLVYYVIGDNKYVCTVLDKSIGYSWACLTGEPDMPTQGNDKLIWFYHIKRVDSSGSKDRFTTKCSYKYILPYRPIQFKKSVKKHKLI